MAMKASGIHIVGGLNPFSDQDTQLSKQKFTPPKLPEPKQLSVEEVMKKKNIKFLPRTGIEQPYMVQAPKFSEHCREYEPISQINVSLPRPFNSLTPFVIDQSDLATGKARA